MALNRKRHDHYNKIQEHCSYGVTVLASVATFYFVYQKYWSHKTWMHKDELSKKLYEITKNPVTKILYTYDLHECDKMCDRINQEHPLLIGLDCEWKPNTSRKQHNKLAVIQISTTDTCLIIHCHQWDHLPCKLQLLLTNTKIIKTGVGIHGDAKVIRRSFGVNLNGYFDIRYLGVLLYENNLMIPKRCFGLKGLTLYLFGVEIPKGSTRSNWQQVPLSEDQILYGSLDAYYSRMTTLMLIYCYKAQRMVHHGVENTLNIIQNMDNTDIIMSIFTKYMYLLNQPFRQPSWLRGPPNPKRNQKKHKSTNNKHDYTLAKLEEKWLGLHHEKYQKKRKHLEYWNMYGADGRFVARVKKKRVVWYIQRNLGVIVNDTPQNGQLPVFQLVFRLKRYEFPGEDAYVMKSCFVCNETGVDGKHLFKHSIFPKCYRKYIAHALQNVLSHEIIPLCSICKERIESANVIYRKHIEEGKYSEYNPITNAVKQVARSAAAILRQKDKLPHKRKQELLRIIGGYYNEENVENISQDMIVNASKLLHHKTFGEILMIRLADKPQELYEFVVGWKQHFVQTLKPTNLKKGWMENGNQKLGDILALHSTDSSQ